MYRICDNIRFKHGTTTGESEEEVEDSETFGILDHQFVFWVGCCHYCIALTLLYYLSYI